MEIRHLSYHYPKSKRNIFNDLSMNIQENMINILLGMNGEGKTTLFDVISGLIKTKAEFKNIVPSNEILYQIQGVPILSTIKGKDLAELILCSSGQYNFRDLSPKLFENELYHDEDSLDKIERIWVTQYGQMSPGERRWFTILLCCLLKKSLYIFDEPTAGTDPYSKIQIVKTISNLQEKNHTVLYATHQVDDLKYLQHYIVHVLYQGKIVLCENEERWTQVIKEKKITFLNAFIGAPER
ncbi:MAG: ABC transporter ATP-binding protein [Sporolactobacillus sp.]